MKPSRRFGLLDGEYDEAAEQAAFQEAVAAWRTRGAPPQPRETTSSPQKTEYRRPDGERRRRRARAATRRHERRGRGSLTAAAARGRGVARGSRAARARRRPSRWFLEAVDSDEDVEDAPQSCRIVHETTALGSNDADEAAGFVDGERE